VIKVAEELTNQEKQVYEGLKKVGATAEEKMKTADDVMRSIRLPKGIVNNALQSLIKKGYIKRVAREKSAGYFVVK
jgi:predicted transcriptional regulator